MLSQLNMTAILERTYISIDTGENGVQIDDIIEIEGDWLIVPDYHHGSTNLNFKLFDMDNVLNELNNAVSIETIILILNMVSYHFRKYMAIIMASF